MFIDAKIIGDSLWVSERNSEGVRDVCQVRPPFVFYHEDERGTHTSLTGVKLRRVRCWTRQEFEREIKRAKDKDRAVYETDISPAFRYLEEKYPTDDTPPVHVSLFDIEVDKDKDKDWSNPDYPYAPITAITLYQKWSDTPITIAVPPPGFAYDQIIALMNDEHHPDGYGCLNEQHGYYLVDDEEELIKLFLELIEDCDVLSGFNSNHYDLPYLVMRIRIVLGHENLDKVAKETEFDPAGESRPWLMKLNLFPCLPKQRFEEFYGHLDKAYEIYGRKHLDYLSLYQKFIQEGELHSYALDAILQHEVQQTKVKYDGDIGTFYRREFRRFLVYNRQDVMGLSAIDDKRRLIELANQMVHMAGVTFDKVTGSVAIIEQALLRSLHKEHHLIAFDKVDHDKDQHVPGAFVYEPVARVYEWGANVDVDSLYPNICISLNISPECMIGQIDLTRTWTRLENLVDENLGIHADDRIADMSHRRGHAQDGIDKAYSKAWQSFVGVLEYHDVIEATENVVTLTLNNGLSMSHTGKEWNRKFREMNCSITGNGTVFDLTRDGIVSACLSKWYRERVEYKNKAKEFKTKLDMANDPDKKAEYKIQYEFYNMVQNARKLFLNSTYGAYLNKHFRFYDSRCGRSVTLSGRIITRGMMEYTKQLLDDNSIIYADTDSTYFTMKSFMMKNSIPISVDNAVLLADEIGQNINTNFSEFCSKNFFIKPRRCTIRAKREAVFDRGLFKDVKKRYALHVVDLEGRRIRPGDKDEVKIVGMEVKRSDTPKYVQDFLKSCIEKVIRDGLSKEELEHFVDEFRDQFRARPEWRRGSPGRVSNITRGTQAFEDYKSGRERGEDVTKPRTHYSVVASLNTNRLMTAHEERRWDFIRDGDKVEVLYLLKSDYDFTSVALKVGDDYVPEWFQQLPFDNTRHEFKLIDNKLDNIFGSLGWVFPPKDNYADEFFI